MCLLERNVYFFNRLFSWFYSSVYLIYRLEKRVVFLQFGLCVYVTLTGNSQCVCKDALRQHSDFIHFLFSVSSQLESKFCEWETKSQWINKEILHFTFLWTFCIVQLERCRDVSSHDRLAMYRLLQNGCIVI